MIFAYCAEKMEIEVENKFVKIFDGVFEKLGTEEISKI
jgi:hypothetical protein